MERGKPHPQARDEAARPQLMAVVIDDLSEGG
jgi:hypothetical protein